jgi:bla regulator protein BlaR1
MENLFYNISQVLGITILHSLWQGLIIYALLRPGVTIFY